MSELPPAPTPPSAAAKDSSYVQVSAKGLAVAVGVGGLLVGFLSGFLVGNNAADAPSAAAPAASTAPAPAPAPTQTDPGAPPAPLAQAPKIDYTGITVPVGVTESGAYRLSTSEGGPLLEVYEDLRCPACQQFNLSQGAVIEDAVKNQAATVDVYLTSYQNSREITNAAACVYNVAPDSFTTFVKDAYAATADPTFNPADPAALTKLATKAGVGKDQVSECISTGQFNAFVDQVTAVSAGQRLITGTPSVIVDGTYIPAWDTISTYVK